MSIYRRTPRTTPAGIATASILVTVLAMAASLLFDSAAPQPFAGATVVQSATAPRS